MLQTRTYHHGEVDLLVEASSYAFDLPLTPLFQKQSTNGRPFSSPLLGILLRGYFIEGNPKQDKLLVAYLKREGRIPLPLIAMITVLVSVFHVLISFAFFILL